MIVCSCKVFSDYEVRTAVCGAEAARTVSEVYQCLGHQPACGRRAHTIRNIISENGRSRKDESACARV